MKISIREIKVYENKLKSAQRDKSLWKSAQWKSAQRDKNQGFDLIIVKISIREIKISSMKISSKR